MAHCRHDVASARRPLSVEKRPYSTPKPMSANAPYGTSAETSAPFSLDSSPMRNPTTQTNFAARLLEHLNEQL
jgi:hypothetical protein